MIVSVISSTESLIAILAGESRPFRSGQVSWLVASQVGCTCEPNATCSARENASCVKSLVLFFPSCTLETPAAVSTLENSSCLQRRSNRSRLHVPSKSVSGKLMEIFASKFCLMTRSRESHNCWNNSIDTVQWLHGSIRTVLRMKKPQMQSKFDIFVYTAYRYSARRAMVWKLHVRYNSPQSHAERVSYSHKAQLQSHGKETKLVWRYNYVTLSCLCIVCWKQKQTVLATILFSTSKPLPVHHSLQFYANIGSGRLIST